MAKHSNPSDCVAANEHQKICDNDGFCVACGHQDPMVKSTLIEIEWNFEDDDPNWEFCIKNATFIHKEACEFILHIGQDEDGSPAYWHGYIEDMRKGGCTEDFIAAYLAAKDAGAAHVLFWA
jgi:hypothetical protein